MKHTRNGTRRRLMTLTLAFLLAAQMILSAQAAEHFVTDASSMGSFVTDVSERYNPASAVDGLNCRELSERWFGTLTADLLSLDSAVESSLETVLAAYFTARQEDYQTAADGQARLLSASDAFPVSETVLAEQLVRMEHIGEMQERLNILITDAVVTVRVDETRTARSTDGIVTMYAYEWTFYDYDDLRDGVGGNDVSGYGTWHKLTLAPSDTSAYHDDGISGGDYVVDEVSNGDYVVDGVSNGDYVIVSDEYDESDILEISTMRDSTREELSEFYGIPLDPGGEGNAAYESDGAYDGEFDGMYGEDGAYDGEFDGTYDEDDGTAELQAIHYFANYDVAAAIAYSETYVYNYNPAYANFNSVGGDCANFSSQTIHAGGMPQIPCEPYGSSGWYYVSASDRSATWTGSTQMRRWMGNNRGNLMNNLSVSNENQVFPGSPVYYTTKGDGSYQHTVICVTRNSAGRPLVNSHNRDRYHVIWNYYGGSVRIDTVQLTSDNVFGDFRGYESSDADFYAELYNPAYGRYAVNNGDGTVTAARSAEETTRIWHFERQSYGAYKITSVLDGSCMAVSGGGYLSRTPIVTESYDGSPGQLWYLYAKSGQGYLLRAGCTDRVLDIPNGSEYAEGDSLWTFGRNDIGTRTGVEAQIFRILKTDAPSTPDPGTVISTPRMRVEIGGAGNEGYVTFIWNRVENAVYYRLKIRRDGGLVQNLRITGTTYTLSLDAGDYSVTLEVYAANGQSSSTDPVSFTVRDTGYMVSYNANGGTGAPAAQVKTRDVALQLSERTPEYTGYRFVNWNTEPDGSGRTYAPGDDYRTNADVVLYAQWEANTYRVYFDPNGGNIAPGRESKTVIYGERYRNMPLPERDQDEFLGWFTDMDGGQEILPDSIVRIAEDHTLCALWRSTVPEAELSTLAADITMNAENYVVDVILQNIPAGSVVYVTGYRDERLIAFDSSLVQEEDGHLTFGLSGIFDTVKVMALAGEPDWTPLCEAAVVTVEKFLDINAPEPEPADPDE